MTIATIDPATGDTLKTFEPANDREIDDALTRAVLRMARGQRQTIVASVVEHFGLAGVHDDVTAAVDH